MISRSVAAAMCVAACFCAWCGSPPLAEPARRIVTLAPHLAELVHEAGAGEWLVGVSEWSDFPPEVTALPRIGNAFQVDLERLAAVSPDLVLGWRGGNPERMLEQLERRGYRVVALAPETLEDVAVHIEEVGRLAGTETTATESAARLREALSALRREPGEKPLRVFYQISARPLYTVGGSQLISEVIRLCGGRNVFEEEGALALTVSLEEVMVRDPQVILAGEPHEALFDYWRRWATISAVAQQHVYTVEGGPVSRPSPRIVKGIQSVCAALDRVRE